MSDPTPPLVGRLGWGLLLSGQAVFVFAVAALTGPGRIDIVDGQTRYEVARSLVEHGDSILRDPNVTWMAFPGRNGERYTLYRIPQSLVGMASIYSADATGPVIESRRHFFFLLSSGVALAMLAVTYTLWFRQQGYSAWASIGWASGGVFCTPSWFYATTTFDDVWGAMLGVMAVATASAGRQRMTGLAALVAGLLLGLAFNLKPPLGLFVLPTLAALCEPTLRPSKQRGRIALVCLGLAAGIAFYEGYEWYKFPPETRALRAELFKSYGPMATDHPIGNFLFLTVSPGAGVLWYCPPVLLGLAGLIVIRRTEKWLSDLTAFACLAFLVYVASLAFAKGDPSWGPRYLTPVCALLWLFVPAGAAALRRRWTVLLLTAGLIVQLLALSVDTHRCYMRLGLPSAFGHFYPEAYFHLDVSHLPRRPMEIMEILQAEPAEEFTPAPSPTFAFPIIDDVYRQLGGPDAAGTEIGARSVRKYRILNSFRPWWHSQLWLSPDARPVDIGATLAMLFALLMGGLSAMVAGAWLVRHEGA